MFSNSSSFLGGGPSARPGGPSPFGQQQPNSFQAQGGGFGGGLNPQMTGYPGQQPMQAQQTGYPNQSNYQFQQQPQPTGFQQHPQPTGFQQQQQPQPTGFQQQQQQQPQPTGFQQQPQLTGFQQPQPTGLQPSQQPPAPQQQPQPTGMTSSQMANSFRASHPEQRPPVPSKSSKIPNVRLSFVTAEDQAKFEQLFKSAVGDEQAMSGDQAKNLLLRSKIPGDTLSDIW